MLQPNAQRSLLEFPVKDFPNELGFSLAQALCFLAQFPASYRVYAKGKGSTHSGMITQRKTHARHAESLPLVERCPELGGRDTFGRDRVGSHVEFGPLTFCRLER
jgi:hypothetical protein